MFICPSFDAKWPYLFIKLVILVYGTDSSRLFIESNIIVIGII